MIIGSRDTSARVLIVAEIGNNHEGSRPAAEQMVREAAQAGADAVKTQTFRTELFVGRSDAARFARLQSFQLSVEDMRALADLARSLGLLFISTPLDLSSADGLESIVDAFKIASGDLTFRPLIERVAGARKPVILSSGASSLVEIGRALDWLRDARVDRRLSADDTALLHCVSSYPVPERDASLATIATLVRTWPVTVGYSDHVIGLDAAVLAVAAGARIVEKHFTLDKQTSDFRDHQLSADPTEMSELVVRIRHAELLLGDGEKRIQASEAANRPLIRRSVVASRDLPRGHVLGGDDVAWLRPEGALAPGEERSLFGKPLTRSLTAGDHLGPDDVA
jgi:N,N'-diacetyllegionaminate synthase